MNRIRNRIFIQLFIPITVFYLIIIGGGLLNIRNSYKISAINQKKAAQENIVRGIDDWLLSRISEVVQLSRIPLMKDSDTQKIHEYLDKWRYTLSFHYEALYLIEPDGKYWSTTSGMGYLNDEDYINRFIKDKSLLIYEGLGESFKNFEESFLIGVPVFDEYDKVSYILTATISQETLQRVFGFFTYEDFDSWMVINPTSTIISHNNSWYRGKNELLEYDKVFLNDQEWKDQQVFVKVMRNGWKLVAFLETDNLLKTYKKSYYFIAMFSIILFVFLVIFVLLLSSSVANPIKKMTDHVNLFMKGDYKQVVNVNTNDELQELADSFNRLGKRMITLRTDDRFLFLGHISARMAHELRKPLNIIQLCSKSLGSDPVKNTKYRSLIDEEVENADKFISEILNFAHNDNLNKVWYSLETLLQAVIEKFQLVGDHEGIAISLDCNGNFSNLFIDIMRLEEVFSNLIQNGMDSILESDSKEKWIKISLYKTDDNEIHLLFNDSGPGFDESNIDSLFDPYYTTRDKGTGLGLSLSYRVLTAHNASITLKNDKNHHGLVKIIFSV